MILRDNFKTPAFAALSVKNKITKKQRPTDASQSLETNATIASCLVQYRGIAEGL